MRKDEPTQNAECLDWHPAFFWGLIQKKHWDNTMSKIIVVVALSCAVATSVFELWLRSVEGDEMSEYHYLKAKSYVFDSMILVLPLLFCFNSLYDTFSGEPFFTNVGGWLLMFIGFLGFLRIIQSLGLRNRTMGGIMKNAER